MAPSSILKNELDLIIDESVGSCRVREAEAFDEATKGTAGVVLFGAGGLGRKVLSGLRQRGIEPIAFVDKKLAGSIVEGLRVFTPSEAGVKYGQSMAFVVTIWAAWADSMLSQMRCLREQGCEHIVPFPLLLWKYPQLLPHVQIDLPSRVLEQRDDVGRCFDLWVDESSRKEYLAQLRWRLYSDFESLPPALPTQYWQRDLIRLGNDSVFADVGAFDGDTIAQFVSYTHGQFKSAYAFEPDPNNFQVLQQRLSQMAEPVRRRIRAYPWAVGDENGSVMFEPGGGVSSRVGGSQSVQCAKLDNALPEMPDFIKYDVEGFEIQAIRGSQQLIRQRGPAIAACVYHIQDHLWKIPLLIHSLNQAYRFYLRPHGQIWETVCYAVAN
jgi:FkbM family methyltransferase